MHELSLASEIVTLAKGHLKPADQLLSVTITVGALSGVQPEALEFCFFEAARQSGMPNARLDLKRTEACFKCDLCKNEYSGNCLEDVCPACQSFDRTLISGDEFTIDSIEIDEGASNV